MNPHTHHLTHIAGHLGSLAGPTGSPTGHPTSGPGGGAEVGARLAEQLAEVLGGPGGSVLLLAVLVVPGLVLLARGTAGRLWPYRPCRHCEGTGRARGRLGFGVRPCPRCHATGIRPRHRPTRTAHTSTGGRANRHDLGGWGDSGRGSESHDPRTPDWSSTPPDRRGPARPNRRPR